MSFSTATVLGEKLGIELLEMDEECTVLRMPVDGNTQVSGILHGGATAALCETAASIAALAHAQRLGIESGHDLVAVGTELSISHLRPASAGFVTACATATQLGTRRTVHLVAVTDDSGREIAVATASNMIIEARKKN